MRILQALALALLVSCWAATPAAAQESMQHQHTEPEKLGKVHFETSCRPAVAPAFDRAVALLHSFSFSSSKRAFEAILADDPACAMAYWGVAMAEWGNPFAGMRSGAMLERGGAAAARGLTTGSPTPRERDYLTAVGALYRDHATVDHRTRIVNYERAMEALHTKYPEDREATAFYALAVNQTALPTDKTFANQLKAAGMLEELARTDPDHPGLTHYIIHAYDHPPLAERALGAARRYAAIAPSAPHALHMPSHTFTRVGSWQESIDTNIGSAASAIREGTFAEALHAMDYQTYAYLQTGQDAAAKRVVDEAPRLLERVANAQAGAAPPSAGYYAAAAIPARYALERGAWAEAAALAVRATPVPYVDAVTHFARALGAARSGNPAAAAADIAALVVLGDKLAAANETYWAGQVRIQRDVATAWVNLAEGRRDEALARMRAAADAEDATDKSAISPGPLTPARELLGEMLLAANQPADALKEFEATMRKEPNRFRSAYFAGRAAALAGDTARANTYFKSVAQIAAAGDTPGRPELQEVRGKR